MSEETKPKPEGDGKPKILQGISVFLSEDGSWGVSYFGEAPPRDESEGLDLLHHGIEMLRANLFVTVLGQRQQAARAKAQGLTESGIQLPPGRTP